MKPIRFHIICFAALAAALAGCHRTTHTATGERTSDGSLFARTGGTAGNGEGYLGLVSRAYQVIPGHECDDGTTRQLSYAASVYKGDDGKLYLTGDGCSKGAVPIAPEEITLAGAQSSISVRGGIFDFRETAPVPVLKDQFSQFVCAFRINGTEYSTRIKSDMSGAVSLLGIHKKWTEPGATTASSAWVTKFVPITIERIGTQQIYRSTSADVLIEADLSNVGYKGKVWTTYHYSGSETIDTQAWCYVNREIPGTK